MLSIVYEQTNVANKSILLSILQKYAFSPPETVFQNQNKLIFLIDFFY